ncbi:hypothetical protein [Mycolicibacterium vulneris]|uniref:hypothetical protein n=1 Tax=Mycolicibacterium vulneris TaxID=547163 RepID=UPI000A1704AF|nr:hypothetical protein [Mycolicibacterium vulneris]
MNQLVAIIFVIAFLVIVLHEVAIFVAGIWIGRRWQNEIARRRADRVLEQTVANAHRSGYLAGYDRGYRRL